MAWILRFPCSNRSTLRLFGSWSYEVHDTKLARNLKAKFAIQLALYADLIGQLQGTQPPALRVVLGDGRDRDAAARDFIHYVRHAMRRLETAVAHGGHVDLAQDTASGPCAACSECRWQEHCTDEWEAKDNLHRVANIRTSQVSRLRESGIQSVEALAALPADVQIRGLDPALLGRLQSQAALQNSVRGDPEGRRYLLIESERAGDFPAARTASGRSVLRHGRRPALPGRRARVPLWR